MLPPEKIMLYWKKRKAREARYDRKQRLRHGGLPPAALIAAAPVLAISPNISGVMAMVSCRFENRL
jgi:hypothetical protein